MGNGTDVWQTQGVTHSHIICWHTQTSSKYLGSLGEQDVPIEERGQETPQEDFVFDTST